MATFGVKSEEGRAFDWVAQDLIRLYGGKSTVLRSIRSSSRVKRLDYCQSELSDQVAGVPKSLARLSRAPYDNEKKRLPRKWGAINHDFVVVHITGKDAEGQELEFCIVGEKIGEGVGGASAGIYIRVMSDEEVADLHRNVLRSWDCKSFQVPLDVVTKALWKNQDPNYHFLRNNCWSYAKAACTSVLELLSKQPNITTVQRSQILEDAQEVSTIVVKTAVWESSARAAMYMAAAGTLYYGFKFASAMYKYAKDSSAKEEEEEISATESNKTVEDDKQKARDNERGLLR